MTTVTERHLKTGGDPRSFADYVALHDELKKLTHPARPDVNWPLVETRCISLFELNGVELQTTAWYTLARTHLAGVYGLNEGLAILVVLISRQWGYLWPQPVQARMEILGGLSKRLCQVMRTLTLHDTDLSQLYQAEQHLMALGNSLQRLELKHLSQIDTLYSLIHNAAMRLESRDHLAESHPTPTSGITLPAGADGPPLAITRDPGDRTKWIYVVQPNVEVVTDPPPAIKPWKPFMAGMLTMLVVAGGAAWSWQRLHQPDPLQMQFAASLAPLPATLPARQLEILHEKSVLPETTISMMQQQLVRLAQLPPDWNIEYGSQLVQQGKVVWPEQAAVLTQQWQQQLNATALPPENLNGWHQGMMQLQHLTDSLNALDERRGRYLTASELKTMVFTIMQSLNSAVPVEEQLRLLAQTPAGQPMPSAQQNQAVQHLKQLIACYSLLKQKSQSRAE